MRKLKLTLLTFMLFSITYTFGQETFKVEYGTVVYSKFFPYESGNMVEQLKKHLVNQPEVYGLSDNGVVLIGGMDHAKVNYNKYGGKYFGTWTALNYPLSAALAIQFKKDGYVVIVRGIKFEKKGTRPTVFDLNEYAIRDSEGTLKDNGGTERVLSYLDQYFKELFTIPVMEVTSR
ncbi:hypothetical protein [Algivirga pacifica]|uniref:DUF4468 domain-containing protein n=1 Tax=Algivirga pacifica TaxID=1162670 RepID=A0ABP9DCB2_9BACT